MKHNGVEYATGSFIEAEVAQFEQLINDGVLRVVDGAKTIEQAMELAGKEVVNTVEEVAEIVENQDTWGAKPDPVVTEEVKEPVAPVSAPVEPVAGDAPKVEETKPEEVVPPVIEDDKAPVINADNL